MLTTRLQIQIFLKHYHLNPITKTSGQADFQRTNFRQPSYQQSQFQRSNFPGKCLNHKTGDKFLKTSEF